MKSLNFSLRKVVIFTSENRFLYILEVKKGILRHNLLSYIII